MSYLEFELSEVLESTVSADEVSEENIDERKPRKKMSADALKKAKVYAKKNKGKLAKIKKIKAKCTDKHDAKKGFSCNSKGDFVKTKKLK